MRDPKLIVVRLVAAMALVGAACGTGVALLGYALLCEDGCAGSHSEQSWQFVIALAGLVVVAAAAYAAVRRRPRVTLALLALGTVLYGAWAILLDAATHGWSPHGALGPYPVAFGAGAFVVVVLLGLAVWRPTALWRDR